MKTFRKIALIAGAVLSIASFNAALAGDKPEGPGRPPGGPGIEIPRIGVPKGVELPADLKALVDKYQDAAKKFAADQKDLIALIRGATEEDKAKLKEQLKTNRDKFLEDTKQLRADIREQVRELRAKLKESGTPVDGGTDRKGKGRN